jgi:hypothetical protein
MHLTSEKPVKGLFVVADGRRLAVEEEEEEREYGHGGEKR